MREPIESEPHTERPDSGSASAPLRRPSPRATGSGQVPRTSVPSGQPALPPPHTGAGRTLWSYQEIAAHLQVQPDTVRSYRKYGLLPPPDLVAGGKPLWHSDTIHTWNASRPRNRSRNRGRLT